MTDLRYQDLGGFDPEHGSQKQVPQKKGQIAAVFVEDLQNKLFNDNTYNLYGCYIEKISIVGRILKMEQQATKILITINDSTGSIDAIIYKQNNTDFDVKNIFLNYFTYTQNDYVKVVLSISAFKDEQVYVVQNLQNIRECNEITHHILKCCLFKEQQIKGPLKRKSEDDKRQSNSSNFRQNEPQINQIYQQPNYDNNNKQQQQFFKLNGNQNEQQNYYQDNQEQYNVNESKGASNDDTKILNVVRNIGKSRQDGHGVRIQELVNIFKKLDQSKIKIIINNLVEQGEIYELGNQEYRCLDE